MKKNQLPALLFCFALSNFSFSQVFQKPIGTAANQSLGGATLAWPGAETGFSNEAILPFLEKKLSAAAGAALPFSIGGWQTNHFFATLRADAASGLAIGFDNSKIENYGEQQFRLGYGRRLGKQIGVGISLSFLRFAASEYDARKGATAAVSFFSKPFKNLMFSARLQNPFFLKITRSTSLTNRDLYLPVIFQTGFCWLLSQKLRTLFEVEKDLELPAIFKFGISYQIHQKFIFRIGCRTTPARPAFGVGLKIRENLRLDFGSEWHPVLGITPAAGVFYSSKK